MTNEERNSQYQTLYKKFRDMNASGYPVLFKDCGSFRDWMYENGWDYSKKLKRKDESGPWSPDNCVLIDHPLEQEYRRQLIAMWDNMVTPIRERYKEELAEIERRKPKVRECFRYEHPDLVREGHYGVQATA